MKLIGINKIVLARGGRAAAFFAAAAGLLCAHSLRAASWTYSTSDEIEIPPITEDSTITVSAGVTVTNTVPLTGSAALTVNGGGTLFLSVDSPDFSGGLNVGKAIVSVATGGAFGTGDVTITGYAAVKGDSRVEFVNDAAAITVANDFHVGDSGAGDANKASFYFKGATAGSVTFTGKLYGNGFLTMIGMFPTIVNFNNDVVAIEGTVYCRYACNYYFNGRVVAKKLYGYSASGGTTTYPSTHLHLSGQNSEIEMLETRMNGTLNLDADEVVGGAVLVFDSTRGMNLNGHSQTAACINVPKSRGLNGGTDASVATLTLTGGVASATSHAVMLNKMSLVIDDTGANGDFEQVQSGGAHTMSGTLAVKRGKYSIMDGATFLKATGLTIGAEGTLKIESGSAMPFANNETVDVVFSTGASYEGDPIEIKAKSLTINGVAQPGGIYTHEANSAVPEGITIITPSKVITLEPSGNIDFSGTEGAVNGYWQVMVPAGVAVTNTTALTSVSGYNIIEISGGGTFVQLVDSPGFDAEVRVVKAVVGVATGGALGTSDVKIAGYAAAGGASRVDFVNGSDAITVANDFYMTGSGESAYSRAQFGFRGETAGSVTFTGKVQGASGIYLSMFGDVSTKVNFNNDVVVDGGTLYCRYGCKYYFNGRVVAKLLNAHSVAAGQITYPTTQMHLGGQNSEIEEIRTRMNGTINFHAADVVGGAVLRTDGYGAMNMNGFDQTAACISITAPRASRTLDGGTGDSIATLTLTGGVESAWCGYILANKLSLVVDDRGADGDFVQTVSNGTHTMSGELKVKRGTLNLTFAATFQKISAVNVEGGELSIKTTVAPFGSLENVLSKHIDMQIADGARVSIVDGLTVNVNKASVGGRGLRAGDYTGEGGPEGATVLPEIVGTGILRVGRSSGVGSRIGIR